MVGSLSLAVVRLIDRQRLAIPCLHVKVRHAGSLYQLQLPEEDDHRSYADLK